jgi:hypothetical protein
MKSIFHYSALVILLWCCTSVLPAAVSGKHPDTSTEASQYSGYLATYFLGNSPKIYMQLSNNNDPYSFTPLNGGRPILTPTLGSKGARDPYLVSSSSKDIFWIIATDLDISKMSWSDSTRIGSKSIFVWESTDLVHWRESLVK